MANLGPISFYHSKSIFNSEHACHCFQHPLTVSLHGPSNVLLRIIFNKKAVFPDVS